LSAPFGVLLGEESGSSLDRVAGLLTSEGPASRTPPPWTPRSPTPTSLLALIRRRWTLWFVPFGISHAQQLGTSEPLKPATPPPGTSDQRPEPPLPARGPSLT